MNLDFSGIAAIVAALLGTGGLISFFYLKQTRESKDLSNAKKVVAEYEKLLETYKKRDAEQQERYEEMEQKYQSKVEELEKTCQSKVEELESTIEELKAQVYELHQKHEMDVSLRCERNGCISRKPRPQNYRPITNKKDASNK